MASRVTRSSRQLPQQVEQQLRARWTNGLTKIFVDLLVDQVQRGNRLNNSFSKKAWQIMCDDFYRKTSLRWDKEQLKNRYAVLRRQYAIVNSLLDQSKFSLDESTGVITANDEEWAKCIKVCPFCCYCCVQIKFLLRLSGGSFLNPIPGGRLLGYNGIIFLKYWFLFILNRSSMLRLWYR